MLLCEDHFLLIVNLHCLLHSKANLFYYVSFEIAISNKFNIILLKLVSGTSRHVLCSLPRCNATNFKDIEQCLALCQGSRQFVDTAVVVAAFADGDIHGNEKFSLEAGPTMNFTHTTTYSERERAS